MANTYVAITTTTVGSGGAATITFDNIPQTYTDLEILLSGRSERNTGGTASVYIKLNDSTSSYAYRTLNADGGTVATDGGSSRFVAYLPQDGGSVGWTANVFSNASFYFPNYASSSNKPYIAHAVTENNATYSILTMSALTWSNTSPITKIELSTGEGFDFTQYSTATLYGIKKS